MDLQEIIRRNKTNLGSSILKSADAKTKQEVIDTLMQQKMNGLPLDRKLVQRFILLENNHQEVDEFLNFLENYQPEPIVSNESGPSATASVFPIQQASQEEENVTITENTIMEEGIEEEVLLPEEEIPTEEEEPRTFIDFLRSHQENKNWFEYKSAREEESFGREQEQEEPASETLAKLLAQQGHKDQAIKMYEKLSLKNPEKKAYFADAIEKLKNK